MNSSVFLEFGTIISIGAIIVISYYLWAVNLAAKYPPHHIAGEGKFIWDSPISGWLDSYFFVPAIWHHLSTFITIPVLLAAGIGVFNIRSIDNPIFHWWLLFWLLDFAVEAKHLASDPNNFSIIHPIAAGLAGLALGRISIWSQARLGTGTTVLLSIGLVGSIALISRHINDNPLRNNSWNRAPDLYTLGVELSKIARPGDLVVCIGLNPLAIYYSGLRGWVFPPADTWKTAQYDELKSDSLQRVVALEELRMRGAAWLIVPSRPIPPSVTGLSETTHILANYLANHYQLVYETSAGRIFRSLVAPP